MGIQKRKIILINPSYQLRFAFLIGFAVFVSSMIYPLTIYDLFDNFLNASRGSQTITERIQSQRESLFYLLAIWQLGFCTFVFIGCVLFSHKIAGPMYKLKTYLQNFRSNIHEGELFFRKGDHFRDIAEEVNKTIKHFSYQRREDFGELKDILELIERMEKETSPGQQKEDLYEIRHRLKQIYKRHQIPGGA